MRILFVTIGAIRAGYGHSLQGFLDSEHLAFERLTMCAYPLVVGSLDFDTSNAEFQEAHQLSSPCFLRNMTMRTALNEQDTGLLLICCLERLPVTSLHRNPHLFT